MNMHIDRKTAFFSSAEKNNQEEIKYWAKATIEDKLGMINFLRECFYGPEATAGRLQRLYKFSKQK